jgi:hypothetical protein
VLEGVRGPVAVLQDLPPPVREMEAAYPAVPRVREAMHHPLVLQAGDELARRLRTHAGAAGQLRRRQAGSVLEQAQRRVLRQRDAERAKRLLHLRALAQLDTLDQIGQTWQGGLGQREHA